jgi:hypothetical protein
MRSCSFEYQKPVLQNVIQTLQHDRERYADFPGLCMSVCSLLCILIGGAYTAAAGLLLCGHMDRYNMQAMAPSMVQPAGTDVAAQAHFLVAPRTAGGNAAALPMPPNTSRRHTHDGSTRDHMCVEQAASSTLVCKVTCFPGQHDACRTSHVVNRNLVWRDPIFYMLGKVHGT